MELGKLVSRNNHMLHPSFSDHHQVSHASADVVSAHGQSKSCVHRERGRKKGREEKEKGQEQKVGEIKVMFKNQHIQFVTFVHQLTTTNTF